LSKKRPWHNQNQKPVPPRMEFGQKNESRGENYGIFVYRVEKCGKGWEVNRTKGNQKGREEEKVREKMTHPVLVRSMIPDGYQKSHTLSKRRKHQGILEAG